MVWKEVCECCGHEQVAYKYKLNQPLVNAYVVFFKKWLQEKRAIATRELDVPNGVYGSFFKLAYFGLIEKEGSGWVPTDVGIMFLDGYRIPDVTVAMGGERLDLQHPAWGGEDFLLVSLFDYDDLDGKFEKKEYYQKQKGFSFKKLFNI